MAACDTPRQVVKSGLLVSPDAQDAVTHCNNEPGPIVVLESVHCSQHPFVNALTIRLPQTNDKNAVMGVTVMFGKPPVGRDEQSLSCGLVRTSRSAHRQNPRTDRLRDLRPSVDEGDQIGVLRPG